MRAKEKSKAKESAWAPFSETAFALLWTATLISNIGTWMHDVGAGWLMTTLDPSPTMVSLVQASTTLPIFLFALLAGALADRLNKKAMLLVINCTLAVVIFSLAVLVQVEAITPIMLLVYTLVIGTGAAFMAPAWQAIVPSLVPKSQLQSAIALNSMGINISRAIGPAIAGILISTVSLSTPFAVNAMSHVVIIAALLFWKPQVTHVKSLPAEPIFGAMVTGLRHAAHNILLLNTLKRALGFFLFASAYWAMLPLIAKEVPGGGPELYGLLLGSIGSGAVAGALLLPKLRRMFDFDKLVTIGTLGTAFVLVFFASSQSTALIIAAAFLAGFSWIMVLTSLNVSAQTALPNWVRARGLAIYLMVFFGSMALGATVWGQVASQLSVPMALLIAAILLVLVLPVVNKASLSAEEPIDLAPSSHWPSPIISDEISSSNRGPVLITITYVVDPKRQEDFLLAIYELSQERYRDGAFNWGIYQDTESHSHWLEWFLVADWTEHLRQHERVTKHDQDLQLRVKQFLVAQTAPEVKHYLAPELNKT